jgi:hypothetical protein
MLKARIKAVYGKLSELYKLCRFYKDLIEYMWTVNRLYYDICQSEEDDDAKS